MAADCTGTALPVTEVPTAPPPAVGWPEALSGYASAKAEAVEERSAFAPFPRTSDPALRQAIKLAKAAREVMLDAYVEGRLRRTAFYKLRDSEELKAARLKAKEAVPFPAELVVPRKDYSPFLVGVAQHFSDGTVKYSNTAPEDRQEHFKRLECESAARDYYQDDVDALNNAILALFNWRHDQSEAEDNVGTIATAKAYMLAHFPVENAAREQRAKALLALQAFQPKTLSGVVEKARAIAALDHCLISVRGACYNGELGEDYDGYAAPHRLMVSIWPDLKRLVEAPKSDGATRACGDRDAAGVSLASDPDPLLQRLG